MSETRNPQAEQMADESMVRNLAAQTEAVWPQEQELFRRYGLKGRFRALDLACGTGEVTRRLAELCPEAELVGVDLHEPHLERARVLCRGLEDRVRFQTGDAFALEFPDGAFDLGVCRFLLHAVPEAPRVVAELVRVVRPGGRVHLLAEDYAMMHFHPTDRDTDEFWRRGPMAYARKTGSDLQVGRSVFTLLRRAGLEGVRVDYVVVDPCRVPRETFAAIWRAWRDGYTEAIARESGMSREDVRGSFDTMIAAIRDPDGYGVWQIPVATGIRPA